jgi:hypothetical protein
LLLYYYVSTTGEQDGGRGEGLWVDGWMDGIKGIISWTRKPYFNGAQAVCWWSFVCIGWMGVALVVLVCG